MRSSASPDFWRDRRVFLTGHTGFKGGWLALMLGRLGACVTGYALPPPTTPNLFDAVRLGGLIESHIGDIRDGANLRAAMATAAPDIVFHLAAQSLVRPARADPVGTFATNVTGTVELLEAIRATPTVRAVVIVTSDKVYDNVEWAWPYREADRLGGKEPYGASKACAEIVVDCWRNAFFSAPEHPVAVATARAGNVIGGGDWAEDRLVPDAVRAFGDERPLVLRNPSAVRPWQHVIEPLTGYSLLAERLRAGAPTPTSLNFGPTPDDARSVKSVADALAGRWGGGAGWIQDQTSQPYEARLLEIDSSLARSTLCWTPRWLIDEGLSRTVDWYRAFAAGHDMRRFTLDQLEAHDHD